MNHNYDHGVDIRKHVRAYIMVFAALWILTVITVAVSYLDMSFWPSVILALIIATVKGSLVACCFMHLIAEKSLIYLILVITVIFFVGLLLLPYAGTMDQVMNGE